jgi:hypothetical protein
MLSTIAAFILMTPKVIIYIQVYMSPVYAIDKVIIIPVAAVQLPLKMLLCRSYGLATQKWSACWQFTDMLNRLPFGR